MSIRSFYPCLIQIKKKNRICLFLLSQDILQYLRGTRCISGSLHDLRFERKICTIHKLGTNKTLINSWNGQKKLCSLLNPWTVRIVCTFHWLSENSHGCTYRFDNEIISYSNEQWTLNKAKTTHNNNSEYGGEGDSRFFHENRKHKLGRNRLF